MADQSFATKVIGAASQGAVGAFVGATLSAVTEPVVNEVLVKRKPLMVAIQGQSIENIVKFFKTTIATNFVKFPFFEVVNMIMNTFTVPASVRGTVTGVVFTSATLPITNYRFKKSMNLPIGSFLDLYQAYLPTVGRDVLYGIARNNVMQALTTRNPTLMSTPGGRARAMFATVAAACLLSAPGNEYRGFVLQPKGKEKPFSEFFDPSKSIRSITIGGLIMSTSLAIGAFSTPFVEAYVSKLKEAASKNPLGALMIIFFLIDRLTRPNIKQAVKEAIAEQKA